MAISALIEEFKKVSASPKTMLANYKAQGKKAIGCMPYYVPEELVYAAGMVPMGVWGCNGKQEVRSKEYCASFYCTVFVGWFRGRGQVMVPVAGTTFQLTIRVALSWLLIGKMGLRAVALATGIGWIGVVAFHGTMFLLTLDKKVSPKKK